MLHHCHVKDDMMSSGILHKILAVILVKCGWIFLTLLCINAVLSTGTGNVDWRSISAAASNCCCETSAESPNNL